MYYEGTPLHNHPPHDELIKEMKHKNSMKSLAKSVENMDVTTRTIASSVRETFETARPLSSDLRFIRRAHQGNRTPKEPIDIVVMPKALRSHSTRRPAMIRLFSETSLCWQTQRTHLTFQSMERLACPNTISCYRLSRSVLDLLLLSLRVCPTAK